MHRLPILDIQMEFCRVILDCEARSHLGQNAFRLEQSTRRGVQPPPQLQPAVRRRAGQALARTGVQLDEAALSRWETSRDCQTGAWMAASTFRHNLDRTATCGSLRGQFLPFPACPPARPRKLPPLLARFKVPTSRRSSCCPETEVGQARSGREKHSAVDGSPETTKRLPARWLLIGSGASKLPCTMTTLAVPRCALESGPRPSHQTERKIPKLAIPLPIS